MFYLTTHSTHFYFTVIWRQTYSKGPLSERERERERGGGEVGDPLQPLHGQLVTRDLIYVPFHGLV